MAETTQNSSFVHCPAAFRAQWSELGWTPPFTPLVCSMCLWLETQEFFIVQGFLCWRRAQTKSQSCRPPGWPLFRHIHGHEIWLMDSKFWTIQHIFYNKTKLSCFTRSKYNKWIFTTVLLPKIKSYCFFFVCFCQQIKYVFTV